jgi:dephospho-CoA kinase
VFDERGRVDRRRLGRKVFASAELLARLEAIVHPSVMRRCAQEVAQARARGARVAVVDAALLFEVALPFAFDLAIALTCERGVRVERLRTKGGWSDDEIRARLARQDGLEKNFYKADAVVDTGRELAAVLADVDALVEAALNSERP